jgi:geranylgeranyl pyrophosphate synthase
MKEFIDEAFALLETYPESPAKMHLTNLVKYTIERTH